MTALVAVMNKEAVALAADSAGTLRQRGSDHAKIYRANKLFALSKRRPIGAMWYNNSQFLGIPFEVLVKEFRRNNPLRSLCYLEQWEDAFIAHLRGIAAHGEPVAEHLYYLACYEAFLSQLKATKERLGDAPEASGQDPIVIMELAWTEIIEKLKKGVCLLESAHAQRCAEAFCSSRAEDLRQLETKELHTFELTDERRIEALATMLVHQHQYGPWSGLVIAGFGDNQWFPGYHHLHISGSAGGVLRIKRIEAGGVSHTQPGRIVAFAQNDVVRTFVEGVHPSIATCAREVARNSLGNKFPEFVRAYLETKIDADLLRQVEGAIVGAGRDIADEMEKFHRTSVQQHSGPLIESVNHLSKDELANLAESLVMITSLRRRMDIGGAETVGGPIDVAVVSRTEGFVWIKRKHYFDGALNPAFVKNHDLW